MSATDTPATGGAAADTVAVDACTVDSLLGLNYSITKGCHGYEVTVGPGTVAHDDIPIIIAAKIAEHVAAVIARCGDTDPARTGPVPLSGDDLCLLDPATGQSLKGPAMYPLKRFKADPLRADGQRFAPWRGRKDRRVPLFVDANGNLLMGGPEPRLRLSDGRVMYMEDGKAVWVPSLEDVKPDPDEPHPMWWLAPHFALRKKKCLGCGFRRAPEVGGGDRKAGDSDDDLSEVD